MKATQFFFGSLFFHYYTKTNKKLKYKKSFL